MPIARPLDPAHIALEESLEESVIASALMCASFNRRGSVDFARRMTDRVPLVGSMCAELGVAEIRIVEKLSSLVYSRNPREDTAIIHQNQENSPLLPLTCKSVPLIPLF